MSSSSDAQTTELRFRLLAEHAQDVIYRYRLFPTFGSDYVSPASSRVLGYTPEEFYADPELSFKVIHVDDRAIASRMRQAPGDFLEPIRLRWCWRDGTCRWVEHRNVPVYDADRRLIAIEGIGRDVTQMLAYKDRLRESEAQLRRLAARLQTLREDERTHLARELHDELGQGLTVAKLDLERLSRALALSDFESAMALVPALAGSIDRSADTVRRISSELRPPALDQLGLQVAIELECEAMQRRTAIRCRVWRSRREVRLTQDQTIAIFRIVQEALTNVARHSHASAVDIRMQQTRRAFELRVHDNGRGISPQEIVDHRSLGLLGMRERAQMIGGQLEVTGAPAGGTTVVLSLPVARGPDTVNSDAPHPPR